MAGSLLGSFALLFLCVLCSPLNAQNDCGPPPRREREELADLTVKESYSHNEYVVYNCRPGYIKLGRFRLKCNNGRWEETPPFIECKKKLCGHPEDMQFGSFDLIEGEDFSFGARAVDRCKEGYKMLSYRECRVDGWRNVPRCEKIECPQPQILNGNFEPKKLLYNYKELINVLCEDGYQGIGISVCTSDGWQPSPACLLTAGKCNRPPSIENGDIIDLAKEEYNSGESVTFKCQRFHAMEGNAVVTCQNGHWSETPRCIVPCTASEEDMERNNIRLKWSSAEKVYSQHGDTTEFTCKWGYRPAPSSPPFRAQCISGTFEYPQCI